MKAGRLRHRVTIQTFAVGSPQQTPSGGPDGAWTTFATVWASVEPMSGKERLTADMVDAEVTVRMRLRYRAGITAAMRVSFGGKIYDIRDVIDWEESHRELQLLCTEGITNG